MKNKFSLAFLLTAMVLSGCTNTGTSDEPIVERNVINFDDLDENTYTPEKNKGQLGEFHLVNPSDGIETIEVPIFSWTASENAESYTLEICENENFISNVDYIVYYKLDNITSTTFKIQSELANKNTLYYWKVTSHNSNTPTMTSSETFSFFLKAEEKEEVKFDLGDADDWILHPVGSYADVAIDNSNFFGNNEPALAITFKKEDTNRGIPTSDGWIIVTKTVEKSLYGTDALYLNVYYAGHDASLLIRVVDKDNEYWFANVQISNNAKQQVILKFSDFQQRFNDVPVANRHFDYERIKYMEVVFERTFGDGACLISGVKAIKFDNYKNMFIDKVHFNEYEDSAWTNENYKFGRTINGDELTLAYANTPMYGNEAKINGYGFAKLTTNRFFDTGDAIHLQVKYEGGKGNNIILRVYEEDQDRWMFRMPYNSLVEGVYSDILIPFKAFSKSQFEGDGKRQFSFILNLQFGVEGQYSSGSISFKDVEVVSLKDYATEDERIVGEDGIIDNFENYTNSTDLYLIWDTTTENKDEFMALNTEKKPTSAGNTQCAQFEYKADMEAAAYMLPLKVTSSTSYSAFSIMLKDAGAQGCPTKMDIYVQLVNGEKYVYTFESLSPYWFEYTIPFSSFTLTNPKDVNGTPSEIMNGNIVGLGIALQYFNVKPDGSGKPLYTDGNIVYLDEIKLTTATTYSEVARETVIEMKDGKAMIEDAESFESTDDLLNKWIINSANGYESMSLSNDVSSQGGNHSIAMQYQANSASVSYAMLTTISSSTTCKGLKVSIKGDNYATVYINVYVKVNGNLSQYRATLTKVSDEWTEYAIGWSLFSDVNNPTITGFTSNSVPSISKITFGIVDWDASHGNSRSEIKVDNMYFDASLSYSTNTATKIA